MLEITYYRYLVGRQYVAPITITVTVLVQVYAAPASEVEQGGGGRSGPEPRSLACGPYFFWVIVGF